MVESVLANAKELLALTIPAGFEMVYDLSSKIFMLHLLGFESKECINFFTQLDAKILDLKDEFKGPNLLSDPDSVRSTVKQAQIFFYKCLLSPLEIPESEIDLMILETDGKKHMQLLEILELAFFSYITKENNNMTLINISNKLLEILQKFGFKKTIYIELAVLKLLETQFQPSKISEKLSGTKLSYFTTGDENYNEVELFKQEIVSTEFVIQRVHEFIFNNQLGIPPLLITKEILEDLELQIENPKSACNQLVYLFFRTIEEFFSQHRLNACVYKFESSDNKKPELAARNLFPGNLNLRILRDSKSERPHYVRGVTYNISSMGFRDSSRFCYDRLVLFGKFTESCSENDIFLDDPFLSQHLLIICDDDGYYLSDYSAMGLTGRKMKINEEVELRANSVFQLGPMLFVAVIDIYEFEGAVVVKMKVLKGCGLAGANYFGVFRNGNRSLLMGRAKNADVYISQDQDTLTVRSEHCRLELKERKVFLKALEVSNGTFVNLKNLNELRNRSPSGFYYIGNDEHDFMVNQVLFRLKANRIT